MSTVSKRIILVTKNYENYRDVPMSPDIKSVPSMSNIHSKLMLNMDSAPVLN